MVQLARPHYDVGLGPNAAALATYRPGLGHLSYCRSKLLLGSKLMDAVEAFQAVMVHVAVEVSTGSAAAAAAAWKLALGRVALGRVAMAHAVEHLHAAVDCWLDLVASLWILQRPIRQLQQPVADG